MTSRRKLRVAHQRRRQFQRRRHGVEGVEQGFLVFLQIAIVRQRQSLDEQHQLLQAPRPRAPICRGSAPARRGSSCAA